MSLPTNSIRGFIRAAAVGAVLIAGLAGCSAVETGSTMETVTTPDRVTVSGSAGVVLTLQTVSPTVITVSGSAGVVLP